MYERLVTKLGSSYIAWMMVVTRLGGLVGGVAVVYYVQLTLDLSGPLSFHFNIVAGAVVLCAVTLTVLLSLWETRSLRRVMHCLQLGRPFEPELGSRAGREAVVFSVQHHLREAILVPLVCLPPVYLYLAWAADVAGVVLVHITVATFMGVSVAVSLTYFAIDRLMIPVVRHLTDYGVVIDYDDLPTGRLQNRLIFLFTVIVIVTAVMIGMLANQKVSALVGFPERLGEVIASLRLQTLVISTCAVIMALFLSTLLARSVTTRVRDMVRAMRRVEIGQLDARITAISTDEIGMLGRSFNLMVVQLEQNASMIRELNNNLERKVRERTGELAESKTELQKSCEQLKENDRLKTEFFSSVSHELRTPLTLILAPIASMLEGNSGPLTSEQKQGLDIARRNTMRLLSLINDLLDFAKLNATQMTAKVSATNINEMIDELVSSASLLAMERQVHLSFEPDTSIPLVMVDRNKMEKVVINLVSNALKFTRPEGRVEVSTAHRRDCFEIRVLDTGIGIAQADQDKVFMRFVQIDGSLSRRYDGTGLGLPMAREFVELHGGRMQLTSSPGEGSSFTCSIPLVAAPAGASEMDEEYSRQTNYFELLSSEPTGPTGPTGDVPEAREDADKILIVDDSPEILTVLRSILAPDYQVMEAKDGSMALDMARQQEPDVIISDVMMPRMNGYEFCARIKGDPATQRIGFIMLTAKADTAMKIEGLDQGADDYLFKPFDPDELRARVRSLLKVRRLDRQLQGRNTELEIAMDELTKTRDHLVQSEKMSSLGQLSAGIAHEINNAINAVYNGILPLSDHVREIEKTIHDAFASGAMAALPTENGKDDLDESFSTISDLVEVIENGAKRTTEIVKDLKKFAHPGRCGQVLYDVHEAIRVALNLIKNKLKTRVKVQCEFCENGQLRCSGSELTQVFLNLLDNAAAAIDGKGSIHISTHRDDEELTIRFRDTGTGIPEEIRAQVFDPFFTTKEVGVGTGLGLAISYGIIKGHGGTIEITSPPAAHDHGTEFAIVLPLSSEGRNLSTSDGLGSFRFDSAAGGNASEPKEECIAQDTSR